MTKKDQIALARLYLEGFSSETYKNTGHDDDRYDDNSKMTVRAENLAGQIISDLFEYGNNFHHPQEVLKYSNPSIIDERQDDNTQTTTIVLDIPYDIMGVDGDDAIDFIHQQLRNFDPSGHGGGGYTNSDVVNVGQSENGDGWARFTIEFTTGYDI